MAELFDHARQQKVSARRPRIAKIFEVKMMNASGVMPKMAGTLSTANSTSVLSITNRTRKNGVMHNRPASRTKKHGRLFVAPFRDRQQPPGDAEQQVFIRDGLRYRRASTVHGRVDQELPKIGRPSRIPHQRAAQQDEDQPERPPPKCPRKGCDIGISAGRRKKRKMTAKTKMLSTDSDFRNVAGQKFQGACGRATTR